MHMLPNDRVRSARKAKGYSQVALAEKARVTRQTIGLIEAGKYNPSLKLCLRICYALEKRLDDLFWYDPGQFDR